MRENSHVRFGGGGGETRRPQGRKVRPAPTLRSGKYFAAVAEVTDGQTQLVAPLIPYDTRTARFTPDDCALSPDETTLTCPRGRSSTSAYRSQR